MTTIPISPSSSLGQRGTPRRRLFACQACARRKQRCDKALPVCTGCHKLGSDCVGADTENSVIRAEDGITRKGPLRLLEEEVARLEDKARGKGLLISRNDQHPDTEDATSPLHGSALSRVSWGEQQPGEDDHEPGHWHLEGSDMNIQSLSLSAMAEPQDRAGEFLKQLSIPRLIAGITETYGGNPEKTSRLDCLWDGIARDIRHPSNVDNHRLTLDRDSALHSLDVYLDTVDFRFPRIQLEKVRSGLDAITADNDETYIATLSANPANIFMAYMVVAIVPLVSDQYPISHGAFVSIHILAKSLRVLDRVFRQEDGVDVIQCLHLLVIFATHSSAAGSSWHLIGFAMNKCIALGYHRESLPTKASHKEREQRRWAFWGCYLLDTLISGALGRPKSLDDRYITVALPCASNAPNTDIRRREVDTMYIHLFHYARLMSHVIWNDESRGFDSHLNRLLHWRTTTPSLTTSSLQKMYDHQTSLFNTLMLRAMIEQALIWSHGESFTASSNQPSDRMAREERLRGMRVLEICQAVVKSLDRNTMSGRSYLSLITGYTAFSTGLTLQYYRSCCSVAGAASIRDLVDSVRLKLDVVSRQFPRMQEYRRILDLLDIWIRLAYKHPREWPDERLRNETNALVAGIGPRHLKSLALVIIGSVLQDDESQVDLL